MVRLALVFSIGPKAVFYQLHVWIFPGRESVVLLLQDSLMSTLMKAPPYLFGGIGAAIAGGLFFGLALWLLRRVSGQQPHSA